MPLGMIKSAKIQIWIEKIRKANNWINLHFLSVLFFRMQFNVPERHIMPLKNLEVGCKLGEEMGAKRRHLETQALYRALGTQKLEQGLVIIILVSNGRVVT